MRLWYIEVNFEPMDVESTEKIRYATVPLSEKLSSPAQSTAEVSQRRLCFFKQSVSSVLAAKLRPRSGISAVQVRFSPHWLFMYKVQLSEGPTSLDKVTRIRSLHRIDMTIKKGHFSPCEKFQAYRVQSLFSLQLLRYRKKLNVYTISDIYNSSHL